MQEEVYTSSTTESRTGSVCACRLDGAFGMSVTYGVDVSLSVAGSPRAHRVLLLTEQSAGLSWPVLRAGRLLRLTGRGGVVARRRGALGQRLARPAAGGYHLGHGASPARRRGLRLGRWVLHRRRGQTYWGAGPRWRHGGQGHRRVQAAAASIRGLGRTVQPGGQEPVLVVSPSDLRERGQRYSHLISGMSQNLRSAVTLTNCRSVRARTQKSGMYWNGVPGICVLLPPTEPLSGPRSVQLRDAERLRLPPCDGERNSGIGSRERW